ncbi:MAG: hypothetical protein M3Z92_03070 [Bacteroidota bacterium]|nr:hypothetical protein [Bacteroidota bacterium]
MEFSQKQARQIALDNLTASQFLALSIETLDRLGWIPSHINERGFTAYTNNGIFSWNAKVSLKITNELAELESESSGDDVLDMKGNRSNIQNFITILSSLKKSANPKELESIYENLKPEFSFDKQHAYSYGFSV